MKNDERARLKAKIDAQRRNNHLRFNFPGFDKYSDRLVLGNKETATLLSISVSRLAKMRSLNEIGHFYIRNRPFHTWDNLFDYLEKHMLAQ